jgi:hypothetical protein
MRGQLLDQVDRAVAAAGAADRNRDVAAAGALAFRQPAVQEAGDVGEHVVHDRVRLQPFDHGGVEAGQLLQFLVPVRVRQAAHVEHEVGVARDAALEPERAKQDRRLGAAAVHTVAHQLAQFVHRGARRVQRQVGGRRDRRQQPAFLVDRFAQRHLIAAQRVLAARLAVALHQRRVARVQEHDLAGGAGAAQPLDDLRHLAQLVRTVARVDADAEALVDRVAGRDRLFGQRADQAGRQVVDAVVAEVLEHAQRH